MTTETIETPETQKARGAYYTPTTITQFLAEWALRRADERVLEPSCGDGAFFASLSRRFEDLGRSDLSDALYGVELEPNEARKAQALAPSANVLATSFFGVEPRDLPVMAAVVGNPPYIRYHGWTGEARSESLKRAAEMGVELTGLASSWASFVVWAAAFLPTGGGRIGMVLPAELLSTEYAEPVRRFLLQRFTSVIVIAFDRLAFNAQVDAILVLASNDDELGLRVLQLPSDRALATLRSGTASTAGLDVIMSERAGGSLVGVVSNETSKRLPASRWTGSLHREAASTYEDLRESGQLTLLGEIARVDIGLVTGANSFFVLTESQVHEHGLPASAVRPVVGRPSELRGIRARASELRYLFYPPEDDRTLDLQIAAYLRHGEELGIQQRYKPRTRRSWSRVPLPRIQADAFLPYMAHRGPKLITNPDRALNTNLLHGVEFHDRTLDARLVAAAMLSASTRLSAEIEGRAYGGGVLKLETKEAEQLGIPVVSSDQAETLIAQFDLLDELVREGRADEASARVDGVLGLDHEMIRGAAETFRRRRSGRKGRAD